MPIFLKLTLYDYITTLPPCPCQENILQNMETASILFGSWNISGCASPERQTALQKALCTVGAHVVSLQDTKSTATVKMPPFTAHLADRVGLAVHDSIGPHVFRLHTPDIASATTTTGTIMAFFSVYMPHGATPEEQSAVLEALTEATQSCGTQNFVIGGDFNETWAEFAEVQAPFFQ